MRHKETTTTTLVLEALKHADDFMNIRMLMVATRRDHNHVTAALHHLRKYRAVDVVIEPDGRGWWYATGDDSRNYHHDERAPETRPRRARRIRQTERP